MTDLIEELLTDPEELFPPRPGGMVDTARRQRRAESDQLDAYNASVSTEMPALRITVPVADRAAELARARTFSVSTSNPIVELLGRDDNRRYAVIMTLDEPVVISFNQAAADDSRNTVNAAGLSANGFALPVNVPVPFNTTSGIFCTATSSAATRVSVMSFSFSE